ncbi:MAG: leucine-rich repeat protein [Ruminococcus sp.]|nr:leucine-rich repeat protein [Ruminococcus sp.]
MKKFIAMLSAFIIYFVSVPIYVNAVEETDMTSNITVENNLELWERFLKYDLCILDYDALTGDKKDICRFIFETELNSPDTIVCERARRILAGYDVGERVTLGAVKKTPCIVDKILYCYNGVWGDTYDYIDCVPDIMHIDYDCGEIEYWLNDSGTEKITRTKDYSNDIYYEYEVFENNVRIESMDIKKKVIPSEVISDDVFRYCAYPDDTLYVYCPLDKTSKYYEIPEEVDDMKVIGIESGAFKDCTKCTEIKLPETLEYIETEAFQHCCCLKNVNIPNNVKAIGYRVFDQCEDLRYISIDCPDAMVSPYALEFSYVSDAYFNFKSVGSPLMRYGRNITFGNAVIKIGSAFVDTEITDGSEIVIPETVKIITNDDFDKRGNKGKLSNSISIPKHIEVFGAYQYSSIGKQNSTMSAEIEPAYIAVLGDEWYLSDDTIISGYYGTEAHSYALAHNLTFNPLDDINYGDANNDGKINIADAVSLQKYLFGNGSVGYEADLTKDGIIDSFDMVYMRKIILNHQ